MASPWCLSVSGAALAAHAASSVPRALHGANGDIAPRGAWDAPVMLNLVVSDGFMGLAAELEVAGSPLGPQQMLIDTGSSGIAFCNSSLSQGLRATTYPDGVVLPAEDFAQCHGAEMVQGSQYGAGEWYWGYSYTGDLELDSDGISTRVLRNVTYSVMEEHFQMPCRLGFDGIWGVSFLLGGGVQEWALLNPSADPRNVLCLNPRGPAFCDEFNASTASADWCLSGAGHEHPFDYLCFDCFIFQPALIQTLREADATAFGLLLDVRPSEWLQFWNGSGAGTHRNRGAAYLGPAALENRHYRTGAPQVASTHRSFNQSSTLYWTLAVLQIVVQGSNGTGTVLTEGKDFSCSQGGGPAGLACFVDTGYPGFVFPERLVQALRLPGASGHVELVVEGVGGRPVRFGWPVHVLVEMLDVRLAQAGDFLELGFPLLFFHYAVFDYGKAGAVPGEPRGTSITFVEKPSMGPTKAPGEQSRAFSAHAFLSRHSVVAMIVVSRAVLALQPTLVEKPWL